VRSFVLVPSREEQAEKARPSLNGTLSLPMSSVIADADALTISDLPDVEAMVNCFKCMSWSLQTLAIIGKKPTLAEMKSVLLQASALKLPDEKAFRTMKLMVQRASQWQGKVRKILAPKPGQTKSFNLEALKELLVGVDDIAVQIPETTKLKIAIKDKGARHCACGGPSDGRFMLCCDKCEIWFHGTCVSVPKDSPGDLTKWLCPSCSREQAPLSLANNTLTGNEWENISLDSSDEHDYSYHAPDPTKLWPPFSLLGSIAAAEILGGECVAIPDETEIIAIPEKDKSQEKWTFSTEGSDARVVVTSEQETIPLASAPALVPSSEAILIVSTASCATTSITRVAIGAPMMRQTGDLLSEPEKSITHAYDGEDWSVLKETLSVSGLSTSAIATEAQPGVRTMAHPLINVGNSSQLKNCSQIDDSNSQDKAMQASIAMESESTTLRECNALADIPPGDDQEMDVDDMLQNVAEDSVLDRETVSDTDGIPGNREQDDFDGGVTKDALLDVSGSDCQAMDVDETNQIKATRASLLSGKDGFQAGYRQSSAEVSSSESLPMQVDDTNQCTTEDSTAGMEAESPSTPSTGTKVPHIVDETSKIVLLHQSRAENPIAGESDESFKTRAKLATPTLQVSGSQVCDPEEEKVLQTSKITGNDQLSSPDPSNLRKQCLPEESDEVTPAEKIPAKATEAEKSGAVLLSSNSLNQGREGSSHAPYLVQNATVTPTPSEVKTNDIDSDVDLKLEDNANTRDARCHTETKSMQETTEGTTQLGYRPGLQLDNSGPVLMEDGLREDAQAISHVLPDMRVALKEASA
jgi:hypothetical protein